jgi:hypothetical protein
MRTNTSRSHRVAGGSHHSREPTVGFETDANEHVHCRNYDHTSGYDLNITIRRMDTIAFDERLYLQPGRLRTLSDVVPSGTWQVSVSLDRQTARTAVCSIGPSSEQTVVVECGNGALSVTDRTRTGTDGYRR